jgi:hypothetical protein
MELLNSIFLPMMAGHLIADFWLQPNSWVLHKKVHGVKSLKLIFHVAIASILPVIFTFQLNLWWFVPIIFGSHLLIDLLKTKLKVGISAFLFDQVLHILVLLLLTKYVTTIEIPQIAVIFWIYTIGFILLTNPIGTLTGMFLDIIVKENKHSMNDVSFWIGIMERILILIFIAINQFSAIGFLIAAKSLFRFNDSTSDVKKKTEYFLGTLISFTFAIIAGLAVNKLVLFVKTGF